MNRVISYSVLALGLLGVAFIFVAPLFERHLPAIAIKLDSDYITTRPFEIGIKDKGRGLKYASITLLAGGNEYSLFSEEYRSPVAEKHFTVALLANGEIPEGPALLRVTAREIGRASWRGRV